MRTGVCKLFKTHGELRESHIYPKFTVEYFKKTGSTFVRSLKNPNKRKQDGLKFYLLSHKAEQMFGDREKWFSQKIFYPHQQNQLKSLEYDENLFYFSVSFLWRILIMELEYSNDIKTKWFYNNLLEAEEKWRLFLNSYSYPSEFDRFYLHLTEKVADHNLPFGGVDYYFTRQLDATIVFDDNEDFLAVYGKFLKHAFWAILKGGNEDELKELRINPIKGRMSFPQNCNERNIFSFYINRIEKIEKLPKASPDQQEKILSEIKNNAETFIGSEAWRAIENDIEILKRRKP